jgi:hypothetical protein
MTPVFSLLCFRQLSIWGQVPLPGLDLDIISVLTCYHVSQTKKDRHAAAIINICDTKSKVAHADDLPISQR